MTTLAPIRVTPRVLLGIFLMALGLAFGLDNLGLIDAGRFVRFWPLLLVVLGLVKLSTPGQGSGGVFWLIVGSGLLLHTLHVMAIWRLWPFVFVLVGAQMAYRALSGEGRPRRRERWMAPDDSSGVTEGVAGADPDAPAAAIDGEADADSDTDADADGSTINAMAFLGGVERTVRSSNFKGGSLMAFMGGCEIDLREASMAAGSASLDVTAFWGGIELKVPPDWRIENRGLAILGGFADKTRGPASSPKRLIITGLAMMGGVEIHN
jgi:predicted membrane protein